MISQKSPHQLKRCSACKTTKPISDFVKDRGRWDGLQPSCRACKKIQAKSWWGRNGHRKRGYALKFTHKITLEEYEILLQKQNGVCAVCHKPPSRKNPKEMLLCVDHDHKTGKIRGLLCNSCNRGIGLLRDSPDILLSALNYLRQCA